MEKTIMAAPSNESKKKETSSNNKNLFTIAMKGEWKEVENLCKEDIRRLKLKITKSGATALHVAVGENQVYTVKELVQLITEKNLPKEVLAIQNDAGYAPLHVAASTGNEVICRLMVNADPSLIGVRNKKGETPLFLAALHGKASIFLYLHYVCGTSYGYSYARRKDGDTFLHAAIAGEHLDLADKIIDNYEELVGAVNEKGYTPLHILATKPAAFPSDDVKRFQESDNGSGKHDISKLKAQTSIFCDFIDLCTKSTLNLIGLGTTYTMINDYIEDMREIKKKHKWSVEIMKKILTKATIYEYVDTAGPNRDPEQVLDENEGIPFEAIQKGVLIEEEEVKSKKKFNTEEEEVIQLKRRKSAASESAIIVAAKHGIIEIVEEILKEYPVAINDRDASRKNIIMLAAANRHVNLFNFLRRKNFLRESTVRKIDDEGNSALHVAAVYSKDILWPIPGAAAQMQWEIKWFEYVKYSMPRVSFRRNNKEKSAEEIFTETHTTLVKEGAEWLVKTSESCSVVAALIAAVAFATSASIPGGIDEMTGKPKLQQHTAFEIFAISSLVALCFSVTALTMFLAILTSRFQQRDFARDLPVKLLLGLTSLFISIGAVLVSFSSGHSLVTEDKFRYAIFPVYAATCLPISIFAVAQLPLYLDLLRTNFKSRFDYR
ncbi:hypothetical protein FEM48_ZijujUnG0042400 [Ziziphus jujuba var. spinosa]|uniref:PGG domain-containing protein n=1 Tax=Ziziphus jujuba var. spinosa TaxID=714518 RepID=A0A978U9A5_ZIZJJ|nr:hypothetical protein FEM48_ZijujUnG0042400 [Ziziphus jujuba var. spinosa]